MALMQPLVLDSFPQIYKKTVDSTMYKEAYERVNQPQPNIESKYPSEPIPQQNCVPLMASTFQIDLYQDLVNLPNNISINSLLSVFSRSLSQSTIIGKQQFLTLFLDEISNKNINFDLGVICCDIFSEDALAEVFTRVGYNFQKLSVLVPSSSVHGIVIKIRKVDRKNKPVTRTEVDAIMVYDSAIPYPESAFTHLKPISSSRGPLQRIYLTTMDTPDIRVYCSNDIQTWDTTVNSLHPNIKEKLLLQKCRRPSLLQMEAWNKYMANQVASWAVKNTLVPYQYDFPAKNSELTRIYHMFPLHHPIVKKDYKSSTPTTTTANDDYMEIEDDIRTVDTDPITEDTSSSLPTAKTVAVDISNKRIAVAVNESAPVVATKPVTMTTNKSANETTSESVTETIDISEKIATVTNENNKRLHEEEDGNIPNKKQKDDDIIDYESLMKQALAEFENQISQL